MITTTKIQATMNGYQSRRDEAIEITNHFAYLYLMNSNTWTKGGKQS